MNLRTAVCLSCLSVLALAFTGCGEGSVGGQTRSPREVGEVRDSTNLPAGHNADSTAPGATQAVALPLLRDVAVKGPFAYGLVPDALLAISLEDPAGPAVVSRQALAATPRRLVIDGVHAYVVCGAGGLQVVAIGQPRQPSLVGTFAPESGEVSQVAVRNGLAVAGIPGVGLAILDVSDPSQPLEQKLVPFEGRIDGLALAEQRAYVLSDQLHVIDLTKPSEAKMAGSFALKERFAAVRETPGGTLLLTDVGLRLVNLRVPERPLRLADLGLNALQSALLPVASGTGQGADGATAMRSATPAESSAEPAADATAMIRSEEVPATAPTATPAAEETPAATPVETPVAGELRLAVGGNRFLVLRDDQVLVAELADGKFVPSLAVSVGAGASCLSVAEDLLLVGDRAGKLTVYRLSGDDAAKLGTVDLAGQATAPTRAGDKPPVPVSKEAATAMGTVQPAADRPAGAPGIRSRPRGSQPAD